MLFIIILVVLALLVVGGGWGYNGGAYRGTGIGLGGFLLLVLVIGLLLGWF